MGLQRVGYDWATFTFTITSTLFFFSSSMNFSTSINSRTHHHSQDIEECHLPKTLLVSLSIVMLSVHHQQPVSYCLFSMTTVLSFQECLVWYICVVSVQFNSVTQLCPTLQPHGLQPGFPVHHQLLQLAQTHVHQVGDAVQPSHPLSSPSPPAFKLSQQQGLFNWVSSLHQVAKVLGVFSFIISPSNEYSGQISFSMDWLHLLAVQGTLKSLLQYHSSKASILCHSAFFIVQLSNPYVTTGKTIALTRWIFVGKVMSLFFNMLSRLVITFLPRSKHLLISWLQSPSAVILEPRKIKSITVLLVWKVWKGKKDMCGIQTLLVIYKPYWLTSFTHLNHFHPSCCIYQQLFLLFLSDFHFMDVLWFVYSFTHWGTLGLFLVFDDCKYCCLYHSFTRFWASFKFLLGKYPGVGLLDHMVSVYLTWVFKKVKPLAGVLVPFSLPARIKQAFQLFCMLISIGHCHCFFILAI